VVIASLFTWLQAAQYLSANPWLLVNQKKGDDPGKKMLDSKALSEAAMQEVLRFLSAQAPSPSRAPRRFILLFVGAVGLRSAELLSATLGDLRMETEGWVMQVRGKGVKDRIAAVPGQTLHDYLAARRLGSVQTAPPAAPCWPALSTLWRRWATRRSTSMSRAGCATRFAPGRLLGKCRST